MLAYWQLFPCRMYRHRLTHNVLRANHHARNSQDAHRVVEGQESLMEWGNLMDQAPDRKSVV